jgi:nucleoid DNA-binding protein
LIYRHEGKKYYLKRGGGACFRPLFFVTFASVEKYITYIEELVYLHDCVIIPGFGGLIGHYRSAAWGEKRGMIVPPSKTILFNKHLQQDDGLFASWIARAEGVDHRKAQARVARFRESLLERLEQGERVSLGTIGAFYLDRRRHLAFESSGHNFLTDTQGMLPLLLPGRASETRQEVLRAGSNVLARLFKYGLSAAVITGIIVISQSGIFQPGTRIDSASIQRVAPAARANVAGRLPVISPAHDFVDYTPSL